MLLWFVGTAWWAVWIVLKDRRFDYRLLAVGALLPDVVDGIAGGARWMHSITASVGVLVVVMLATYGRRPIRRRLLAIPFGTFLHLVFDGAFNATKVFWWPIAAQSFEDRPLPSVDRGIVSLALEVLGLILLVAWWRRFDLARSANRSVFVRTGQLPPESIEEPVPTC